MRRQAYAIGLLLITSRHRTLSHCHPVPMLYHGSGVASARRPPALLGRSDRHETFVGIYEITTAHGKAVRSCVVTV